MKEINLMGTIKALFLFLSTANSQRFLLPQPQSYPPNSYEEVIQFKQLIQTLPRTFDPANPTETCYTPLYNADIDNNGLVSIDEYPIFIQQLSNGIIDASTFSDLPFVLQINFVYLNCLCPSDITQDNCCTTVNEGGISTAGTGPGETPTEEEVAYLNVVCSDTQASVDYAIEEGVPTKSPVTLAPSDSPTSRPTVVPTAVPTDKPTVVPTAVPTTKPTLAPSSFPTTKPTLALTAFPTNKPTTPPSASPTSAPVIVPDTEAPTQSPTTKAPTDTTKQPTINAPTSLGPTSEGPTSRQPTVPTPETLTPTFQLEPSVQPSIIAPPPQPISRGAMTTIVLASVAVTLMGLLVLGRRKWDRVRISDPEDPSLGDLSEKDRDLEAGEGKGSPDDGGDDDGPPGMEPVGSDSSNMSSISPEEDNADMEVGNYVPQTIEPPPPCDPALLPIVAGLPSSPRSRRNIDSHDDSSSSAGASGWSSSAGISSLNTGSLHDDTLASESFDTGIDDALYSAPGSPKKALTTIAAETTRVAAQDDSEPPVFLPLDGSQSSEDDVSSSNSPVGIHSTPQGEVSRADLDMAIEAGDWAAVGATAALLAGTTKSESDHDESSVGNDSGAIIIDASNSNEESWAGVVLAASNNNRDDRSEGSGSMEDDTISSGNTDDDGSNKGDRAVDDIRFEVELLVRRVVPDELDNVDEMMLQFKGREEELIETLRSMQERSVAQRARQAVRKSAKMEAKARALENREEQRNRTDSLSSEDPSFYEDSEDDSFVSDLGSHGMSRSDDDPPSSKETTVTSLERAVQQGDWLAVGEAAAMMGGVGIAPAAGGDSETSSYIETDSMHDSSLATSTFSSDENKESRISYLDDLIAKGDWSGIVAAAGKYQAIDEQLGQASEEEREALAEANMWKTIAAHSKESATETDDSAAVATDWAISRSLQSKEQDVAGQTIQSDESI